MSFKRPLLLLKIKSWELRYVFHTPLAWGLWLQEEGLPLPGLWAAVFILNWGKSGQIPTGRKLCRGGWISGPSLGFQNLPHKSVRL